MNILSLIILFAFFQQSVWVKFRVTSGPHGTVVEAVPHRAGPDKLYPPAVLGVVGALNPDVTQSNIQKTICVSNWTKTIRPPVSFTNALKRDQMATLGIKADPSDYEEDHFISLEIGGAPRDPKNLWPEPWKAIGAHQKDVVENAAHRLVCSGQITLAEAQHRMATDWYAWYLEIKK